MNSSNQYLEKYYKQINSVYNPDLAYSDEIKAEIIQSIIDKIYQDGFIDGTNEGNITNGVEPEDHE